MSCGMNHAGRTIMHILFHISTSVFHVKYRRAKKHIHTLKKAKTVLKL